MITYSACRIETEEREAAKRVLESGWVVAGKETEAFEREFAKYVGVKYAIFTNSCTSALKMAFKYFKEQGRDKYYLATGKNTYCATYAAAEEMGLRPTDFNMRKNETVSVAVHYGGVKYEFPCDVEDSAHRIEPNDPLTGKIRCYSFYATKNMTTVTGGMFVTDDKEIYERARLYWRDGLSTSTLDRQTNGYDYEVVCMAGGYDGNDVFAAIGREQLKKLPEMNARRQEIVNEYNKAFGKDWSGLHLYPYTQDKSLVKCMLDNDIRVGFFYPPDGWVCLPLHQNLTDEDVRKVIGVVQKWNTTKET